MLDGAAVPVEIVNEEFCRTIFDDPEARSDCSWSVRHGPGDVGRFEDPGLLVNLSPAEGVIQRGPCLCGEHSREILVEHGYSEQEVDTLVAEGAVLEAAVGIS